MPKRPISESEMEAARTPQGGWSAQQLRSWGVRSPPPRGWRQRLLRSGVPAACPYPVDFEPPAEAGPSVALNPLLAFARPAAVAALPPDAILIHADGSCRPNPGPGGWGFAAYRGATEIHAARGGEAMSTNNRMELTAVIAALRWLEPERAAVLWSDSQYVVRGCIEWRRGWRKANWSGANKAPPANADLWQALGLLLDARSVDIRWTRSHAGTTGNERADALAGEGRRRGLP